MRLDPSSHRSFLPPPLTPDFTQRGIAGIVPAARSPQRMLVRRVSTARDGIARPSVRARL
jgi:hypothetical protein